jgi:hypothetical protein
LYWQTQNFLLILCPPRALQCSPLRYKPWLTHAHSRHKGVRTSIIETSTVLIRVPARHTNFTKQYFLCCLDLSFSIDDGILVHLNVFRMKFRGFISVAVAVSLALVSHRHFQATAGCATTAKLIPVDAQCARHHSIKPQSCGRRATRGASRQARRCGGPSAVLRRPRGY